eukprot:COSAG01_NODE_352_length_18424_cov_29.195034_12_plen_88_part_00
METGFHAIRRNELRGYPCPDGYQRSVVTVTDEVFEATWLNGTDLKASNVHKQHKAATLQITPLGITVERAVSCSSSKRGVEWAHRPG